MPGAAFLNLGNPVADHPLNRPLTAWLTGPPGRSGGGTWPDLLGRYPGTLTNAPTWRPAGRPGGFGAVSFTGGTDYVGVSGLFGTATTGKVASAFCWVRPAGSLTAYQSVFDSLHRNFSAFLGGAANHLYVAVATDGGTEVTLSDSWTANEWQHLGLTCDGATTTVYRNGRSVGTTSAGIGVGMTAEEWRVGANPSGGGASFNGAVDDLRVYGVCLSADQAWAVYDQSRRGYPNALRRWRRGLAAVPSAAATTLVRRTLFGRAGSRGAA